MLDADKNLIIVPVLILSLNRRAPNEVDSRRIGSDDTVIVSIICD